MVVHEVDSWSLNSYLLWKNITDKKQLHIYWRQFLKKTHSACGLQTHNLESSWDDHTLSLWNTNADEKPQEKGRILTPEAKMSQFWIVYVLSWLSNKADDNHPRQHLSIKWETVRIIHLVIRRGDAIKHLQPVQSRLTPLGFMWKHTCSKKIKQ